VSGAATPGVTAGARRADGSTRTYGQYCPIARGLDLIGDRWVLLICRELAQGDQRFTDLRTALAGIAPNLLSERLRDLQAAGLVTTAELPPPAARTVYRLTDEGRRTVPVLRAVARFGASYLGGEPTTSFDARRAAYALLLPWWRSERADGAPERIRLDVGAAGAVDLVRDGRAMRVERLDRTGAVEPGVTLRTSIDALAEARRTDEPLVAELVGAGRGVAAAVERAFDLRFAKRR
jgi:DNA-binding HxlR family transcriptional regulator